MADKDADEEWEEGALYEIAMVAVVTVTASCKIIAAKKTLHDWPHNLGEANSGPIVCSWRNFGKMMPSSWMACVVVGDWLKPLKQF